ncbi:hypothetical protein [Fibrella arboris]|uniref:hypothetical protein n=1 Tax=Fibrella arboris TaxID=3242486 RepID=UPI003522EB17
MKQQNYFALSAGATADAEAVESTLAAAESTTAAAESATTAVESTAASSVLGLLSQAASVNTLPTNRRAITFFMILSLGGFKVSNAKLGSILVMCNIDGRLFSYGLLYLEKMQYCNSIGIP